MTETDYVITKDGVVSGSETNEFIRFISSREELSELIERMPYITTINAPNKKSRRELYDMAMEKYDDVEWVRIIKSVYHRMQDHKYEEFEPEYLTRAKRFLYGEISRQFGIELKDVENFVCISVKKSLEEF
ncbi:MAG: hypothetical protein IJ803_09400 [Oribacterium sp.]|nr:hypothetical protein [Oribacterium sp.]